MTHYTQRDDPALATALKRGAIGVLKTDTLYGILASAQDEAAVKRVYQVRGRSPEKPCIILVADKKQLLSSPLQAAEPYLDQYWPGPVSVILPVNRSVPEWLHRGTRQLAYRMPADETLRRLLAKTGPLIAPSANIEGQPPAQSIAEAKAYFGEAIDFYVDSGSVPNNTAPSKLVRITQEGRQEVLR